MDDKSVAMEMEVDLPEFTFAEMIEMEKLLKEMGGKPIDDKLCQDLSAKFNSSAYRSKNSPIKWTQVQSWFRDKQIVSSPKTASPPKEIVHLKTATRRKQEKVRTISANEAAVELHNLVFEARSAKDYAWFDVSSFLTYRVLSSGELVVRVRFAGFGKEEDEWVSIRRAVRERSIPLEPSECDKVNAGDLVLCFRENSDHALYCDAHVVEIERKEHDSNGCMCIFVIHYDHDNVEDKVTFNKICRRPRKSASKSSEDAKLVPFEPIGLQNAAEFLIKDEDAY